MVTDLAEHPDIIGLVSTTYDPVELQRRRDALGWSRTQLADKAGVSEKTVYNAEHGRLGRTAPRIVDALEQGEADKLAAEQPDLVTWTVEIDGVRLVVTGVRDRLQELDLNALVQRRTNHQ